MLMGKPQTIDWATGAISGPEVENSCKKLRDLDGTFADNEAWRESDLEQVIYQVQYWCPVADGTEGGLFWGNSTIHPGRVGDEYFMTKGHFHAVGNRSEYYATVSGRGMLLLMDRNRKTVVQPMSPGTLHYIPGETAHRVVNVGDVDLTFLASWPADAGYDYQTIQQRGFSVRVVERDGEPVVITEGER